MDESQTLNLVNQRIDAALAVQVPELVKDMLVGGFTEFNQDGTLTAVGRAINDFKAALRELIKEPITISGISKE